MKLKSLCLSVVFGAASFITGQAHAACMTSGPQSWSMVSQNEDNSYHYTVTATGGFSSCGGWIGKEKPAYMNDFYLPYFDDMGISGLQVFKTSGPSDVIWKLQIEEKNDVFKLGGGVIHFYGDFTPETLSYNSIQIDFDAGFGEVKAPFYQKLVDLQDGTSRGFFGDPGMPGSPKLVQALDTPSANVPEPASLSLIALGVAAFALRRRK